jgi:hypothetical protein
MRPIKLFIIPRTAAFVSGSGTSFVAGAVALILLPLLLAWGQAAILGLPFEDLHLPLNGLIEQE